MKLLKLDLAIITSSHYFFKNLITKRLNERLLAREKMKKANENHSIKDVENWDLREDYEFLANTFIDIVNKHNSLEKIKIHL